MPGGPCTADQARDWISEHQPRGDVVDHLDRHFMIRQHDEHLDPPRSVTLTAGLSPDQQPGMWHLVKADDPLSAYNHIRNQTRKTISAMAEARARTVRHTPSSEVTGEQYCGTPNEKDSTRILVPQLPCQPGVTTSDSARPEPTTPGGAGSRSEVTERAGN